LTYRKQTGFIVAEGENTGVHDRVMSHNEASNAQEQTKNDRQWNEKQGFD
jgi:hypothetical protein